MYNLLIYKACSIFASKSEMIANELPFFCHWSQKRAISVVEYKFNAAVKQF